jgi:superkiller protein 3
MGFLGSVLDKEKRAFDKMERSLAEVDQLLQSSDSNAEKKLDRLALDIREFNADISKMKSEFSGLLSKVVLREITFKKYKEAADLARMAVQLDPRLTDARFSLSMALRHSGALDDAIREIDITIKAAPKEKRFWMEKGRILQSKGDRESAIQSFLEASKLDSNDVEIFNVLIQLNPKEATLLEGKAKAFLHLRRYPDAVRVFEEAILLKPDDRDLWLGKAKALFEDSRGNESLQAIARVLSIDPSFGEGWEFKSKILRDSGKIDEAIDALKKGVAVEPKSKFLWNELGTLHSEKKDYKHALEAFAHALEIAPTDVGILRNQKVVLQHLEKHAEVIDICSRILVADPNDLDSHIDKGDAQFALGKFDQSYDSYREAHRLSKDNISVIVKLKDAAKNLGRHEEVIDWSDQILRQNSGSSSALHDKGLAQMKLGRHVDAIKSLEKASKLEPDNVPILDSLKEVQKMVPNDKGVIEVSTRILKIDPSNKHALLDKAVAYDHMNDLERAIESFKLALAIDPADKIIAFDLAVAFYKAGNFDESAETAMRGLKHDGEEPRLWRILGEAELARKRFGEALKSLEKSISLDPNDKGAHFGRGLALMELKHYEQAATSFGKVINMDPTDSDATFQLGLALTKLDRLQEALDAFSKVAMMRPQDVVPLIYQAETLLRMGKARESLAPLTAALRISPDSIDALRMMKDAIVALGDNEAIVRICNDILRLSPRDADALFDKGKAQLALGKAQEALDAFNLALQIRPDDLAILKFKESCLIALEDNEGVVKIGAKILEFMPGDRQTMINMALASERMDQLEEALAIYEEILLANPQDVDVANRKGEVLMKENKPAQAAETFLAALNVKRSGVLLNNYGKALLSMRRTDEALEVFRHAIEESQVKPEYRVNEGRALAALDRLDEALKSFDTALSLDHHNYSALKYRGSALLKMNRADEAMASYEKALQEEKGEKDIFKNMGRACELLSRTREAIGYYQQALREDSTDTGIWLRIGELHASLGEHREAVDGYDRALQSMPEDAKLWLSKGRSLDALGMNDDAVQAYDRAIGIDPNGAEGWELKGATLLRLEKPEAALRAFEHALALNPSDDKSKKGLQQADVLVRQLRIEDYARAVLEFEHAHGRPVTKEEAFRISGIPYAYLDDVVAYVESPVELEISELTQEEIGAYEEASRDILLRSYEDKSLEAHGLRLADIIRSFPEYKITTAKRILAYIQKVSVMSFPREKTEDPQTEHLLRKALDLPDTQKNVIGVIRNLNVGVMTSRRLVSILQTFRGGGFETPTVDLKTIVTEGFGTRVPEQPRVAYAEERTIRDEDEEQREPAPKRKIRMADRKEPEEELQEPEEETATRRPKTRRVVPRARQREDEGEAGGLDRDKENLEGRRCLFHGGVAVARCRSCKAILCKECLRGVDRCPRCDAPFSDEEEDEGGDEPRSPEPGREPVKRAPKEEHKGDRDFSRL